MRIFFPAITNILFLFYFKASHFQDVTITIIPLVTDFTSFPRNKCFRIIRKYKVRLVLSKICQKKQSH